MEPRSREQRAITLLDVAGLQKPAGVTNDDPRLGGVSDEVKPYFASRENDRHR